MATPPAQEPPDMLVIGHATRDLQPGGDWRLGGTVVYAALTACRLGLRAAIVTAGTPDVAAALGEIAPDVPVATVPSHEATTFENRYDGTGRRQYLRGRAAPLDLGAVPAAWRAAPLVLLAPLAQEVDPALAAAFPGARVAATPQGWLRGWDATGLVHPTDWEGQERVLPYLHALIVSRDDLSAPRAWDASGASEPRQAPESAIDAASGSWARQVPLVVVTRGAEGADLLAEGTCERFPAYPTREVDPTGAGDVFAAAFLSCLLRTHDARAAMDFANSAASFAVEAEGTAGIPTLSQVMARRAAARQ